MINNWYVIIGGLGVLLIISAYLMLQIGKLKSTQISYSILNGLGALLILFSLIYSFNLPSFIIEIFWLLISIYGVVRVLISRKRNRK